MITVLAGGVGAARFLRGLVLEVDANNICVVVNTGDDTVSQLQVLSLLVQPPHNQLS